MDKCQKPLLRLRFLAFGQVENRVKIKVQLVEKLGFGSALFLQTALWGQRIGSVKILRRFFVKIRSKTCIFGGLTEIIHNIPICSFHQKWTQKPPETKSFQHCTQVMHSVIHRFGEIWDLMDFACFCLKYAKEHTITLYHNRCKNGICTEKSYDGRR